MIAITNTTIAAIAIAISNLSPEQNMQSNIYDRCSGLQIMLYDVSWKLTFPNIQLLTILAESLLAMLHAMTLRYHQISL